MGMVTHFVGLDVHADSVWAALAAPGRSEPILVGPCANTARAVFKLLSKHGDARGMSVCYEAGPTGYGLQRGLQERGVACAVVAPSLVPHQHGDRVKTDRRDALKLARYWRTGTLTPVHVPDEQTEAIRDLERAYTLAKRGQRVARQSLNSFLLRHGRRWSGRTKWTKSHVEWIRQQQFDHEASRRVLADHLHELERCGERVASLMHSIGELVEEWHLAPLVKALQAFRGIRLLSATILVAELGDLRRFARPTQLMSYLGLTPSEQSSGQRRRQGGITKTGNGHARRVLIEASWAYRFPPKVRRELRERQLGVSPEVRGVAWTAQKRLCARYRRLMARGKTKNKTVTAIARELSAFLWSAAQQPLAA